MAIDISDMDSFISKSVPSKGIDISDMDSFIKSSKPTSIIDKIDEFAKDPIGSIIGKHEKPIPAQKPQPTINAPIPKGNTPWDNLQESPTQVDTRYLSKDPLQIKKVIAQDKQAKLEKTLDYKLQDAPLEERSIDLIPGLGFIPKGLKEINYLGDAVKAGKYGEQVIARHAPLIKAVESGEVPPHVAENIIKQDPDVITHDEQIAKAFNAQVEKQPIENLIDKHLEDMGHEPHFGTTPKEVGIDDYMPKPIEEVKPIEPMVQNAVEEQPLYSKTIQQGETNVGNNSNTPTSSSIINSGRDTSKSIGDMQEERVGSKPLQNDHTIEFNKRASHNIDEIKKITSQYAYAKPLKPNEVYRGVSDKEKLINNESGAAAEGVGLYTTTNKDLAKDYGEIVKLDSESLPKKPLAFPDYNAFEIWQQQIMYKVLKYGRKHEFSNVSLNEIVHTIDPSIDGIQIGKGKKAFFVKYPDINELRNKGTLLSKSEKQGATTTLKANDVAKKFLGKQYDKLKGDINIVQSYKDLPQDLRSRSVPFSSDNKVRGVFDPKDGKVHLVADTMNEKEVPSILAHELLHKAKASGVKPLGEAHDTFVLRLKQMKDAPLVQEAYKAAKSAGTEAKHMDEEMMAYLVQAYQHGKSMSPKLVRFVKDIIEKVKVFAQETAVKLGVDPKWLISKMNEKDIAAILKTSSIKQGEKVVAKGDTLFSKAKDAIKEVDTLNQSPIVKQAIKAELKRSIPEIIEGGSDKAIQFVAKKAIQAADIITAKKVSKLFNYLKDTKLANDIVGHKIYQAEDYLAVRDTALQNISKGMKTAEHMHNMLKDLSSQAREAMYDYVTGYKDVQLSDELKKAADNMVELVDKESKKQVANGTLSKEAYEEWAGQYLHRQYASKINKMKDIASGGKGFTAEPSKARGKSWTGTAEELKELEAKGEIGKVSEGKVEAETLPNGKVEFRRDWTREERKNMGEIRDIAFSFPETYGRLSMLSEHGRMLKMVPEQYLMEQGKHTEQWMEQSGYTKLSGKKYGALNGRWVDNTIADDITAISERITGDESMKAYKEYVSAIKASHTIHNYKAHVNNTVSGVIMQFTAGLNPIKAMTYATQGAKALGNMKRMEELVAKKLTGLSKEEALEFAKLSADKNVKLVEEADQYGLFGRSQLNSILRSYISPTASIEETGNKVLDTAQSVAKANAKAYEMEDNMMRFSAFKQLREKGMEAREAVKKVNDDIIPDYSKPMSKMVRAARDSGIVPFASWLYYSTPLLLKQLKDHPTRGLALIGSIIGMDMAFGINPFNENDIPQEGYAHQNVVIGRHGNDVDTMRIQSMIPQSQFLDPYESYVRSTITGGIPQQIMGTLANIDLYKSKKITSKKGMEGAYQWGKYATQNMLPTPDVLDQLYNIAESHVMPKNKRRNNNVMEPRTTKQEFLNLLVNTSTYNKSKQREEMLKQKVHDRK